MGVQQALQAEEPRLIGNYLQSLRQPLLGECHISPQQRRMYASEGRDPIRRTLSEPLFRRLFSAAVVAAEDVEVLEVAGPGPGIRPHRPLVGQARFAQPPDMLAD